MLTAECIFWTCASLTVFLGGILPAAVMLAGRKARQVSPNPTLRPSGLDPTFTILIAAFHAEEWILDWLRHALEVAGFDGRTEVAIVCGGDGDLTADVARTCDDPRIRVVQARRGVAPSDVMASAVESARGDVVVWVEPGTRFTADALTVLGAQLTRPMIGLIAAPVSSSLDASDESAANLAGFEDQLSEAESSLGVYLPVAPGVVAARRELWQPAAEGFQLDPLATARECRRNGMRVEFLNRPLGDRRIADLELARLGWQSWKEKGERLVRMARTARSLRAFWRPEAAFFWLRHVGFWLCPVLMFVALAANCALSGHPFYLRILLLHETLYLAGLVIVRSRQARYSDLRTMAASSQNIAMISLR